jgi:hypothetical protein
LAPIATRVDDIKPGVYDLVFFDGTGYLGGAGVHISAGGLTKVANE